MKKRNVMLSTSVSLVAAVLLSGCGGGETCSTNSNPPVNNKLSNVFKDSTVIGLPYLCSSEPTRAQKTLAEGRFECKEGDTVEFMVGKIVLGQFTVKTGNGVVSPYDIAKKLPDGSPDPEVVTNIAQILQSLDTDGDLSTININDTEMGKLSTVIDIDDANFDAKVGAKITLVSEVDAQEHLDKTFSGNADILPPVIEIDGDNPFTLKEGRDYNDSGAVAVDARDGNVSIVTTGLPFDTGVLGDHNVTYSAEDEAGNKVTAVRTVTVVPDLAPKITINGSNPATVLIGNAYTDAGAKAIDEEDGDITSDINTIIDVNTSVLGTNYSVLYSVTDSFGNETNESRKVIVADEPPVITILGDNPATVEVGDRNWTDPGATAMDREDGNITANIHMVSNLDIAKIGTYTTTYFVEDNTSNHVEANRTINVVDTTLPVVTLIGNNPIVSSFGRYNDPGATASDNIDGNLTSNITYWPKFTYATSDVDVFDYNVTYADGTVKTVGLDVNTSESYIVTYIVEDTSGNKGSIDRNVTINTCSTYNPVGGGCTDR